GAHRIAAREETVGQVAPESVAQRADKDRLRHGDDVKRLAASEMLGARQAKMFNTMAQSRLWLAAVQRFVNADHLIERDIAYRVGRNAQPGVVRLPHQLCQLIGVKA